MQLLDLILREKLIIETLLILSIVQDTFFLRMVELPDLQVMDLLFKNLILLLDLLQGRLKLISVVGLYLIILSKGILVSLLMQLGMVQKLV